MKSRRSGEEGFSMDKAECKKKEASRPRAFFRNRMASALLVFICAIAAALVGLSLAVHFHRSGAIILLWSKAPVSGISHDSGFAYIAASGHPELSSGQHPTHARLLEDGKQLPGSANAPYDSIRQTGMGRYSFADDTIYFSSLDNSDPRTNGRVYEIYFPLPIGDSSARAIYYAMALAVLLACGLFLFWMIERIHGNKLTFASIFLFILALVVTELLPATNGKPFPLDSTLTGLILMALALAGLIWTEDEWGQQLSRNGKLSTGLMIGSIAVSVSLLAVLILPSSLYLQTRQMVFVAAIGTLTFSVLMVRQTGWSAKLLSSIRQAPFTAIRKAPALGKAIEECSSLLQTVSRSTLWTGYLLRAATLALPFLAYAAVLASDIPGRIGLEARTGVAFLLPFAVLLYPVFRRSGWWEDLVSLAITLMFFALPLSGLWNSGYSNGSTISGLLPFSDASNYYMDANRLLEGGLMSAFSERRPLFPGTLAAVLGLVNGNLAVALAVFGAAAALACFLLARELRRSHGTLAGLATLAVLFLFYCSYIGLAMTENLGIALGALALAVLWRGAGSSKKEIVWVGIFLLTMALNARAGAFLVLPMLVLWGSWYFRGNSRISLRFFFGGCGAILIGFLLDAILRRMIANSGGMAYGNFSYSLYGLVVGNKGWLQAGIDHPEILTMDYSRQYSYVYQLAFQAFRTDPIRTLGGFLGAWKDFLTPNPGAFGFINFNFFGILNFLEMRWVLLGISVLGLLGCIRRARDPQASLVLASTIGILASVPFAPPIDSDAMRVYAATIPFAAIWVALGLYTLFRGGKCLGEPHPPLVEGPALSPVFTGLVFALFCFLSPILVKGFSRPTQVPKVVCPSGLVLIHFRTDRSAAVNLVSDDASRGSHLPDFRLSDFKNQLHLSLYPELEEEFTGLIAGQTILQALDLEKTRGRTVWLIIDSRSLPPSTGIYGVCAHPSRNEWLSQYRFYYVDTIEPLQAPVQ
jgi:hypothetical protein